MNSTTKEKLWDLFVKIFWTAASLVLAFVGTQLAGVDEEWALIFTPIVNTMLIVARQQVDKIEMEE